MVKKMDKYSFFLHFEDLIHYLYTMGEIR